MAHADPDPDQSLPELLDDHDDEIKALVKREAELAYEAHQELEAEHADAAAVFSPTDLLPKVDDALGWIRDRVGDDEDAALDELDTAALLAELDQHS
ncbi:MAG: hypothetical protein ABEH83_00930 [Halobacterium sp.]